MNKKVKQNGLFVLSALTLGTAVVPALVLHPGQAQAAYTTSENEKRTRIDSQIAALRGTTSLTVFDYVKSNILKDLKTLPASLQAQLQAKLDEAEVNVIRHAIDYKNVKFRGQDVSDLDLFLFEKDVYRMPKTSKYYIQSRTLLRDVTVDKARSDATKMELLSRYKMLTSKEIADFERYVTLVPSDKNVNMKKDLKNIQKKQAEYKVRFALQLAEKIPDKTLISKIKKDANALPTSTFKSDSLKKLATLEKKQKVYSSDVLQSTAYSVVGSTTGREYLPSYVQELVEKKLIQIKTKSPRDYQQAVRKYYGTEIFGFIGYLKQYDTLNTRENVARLKSDISEYEKKTGDTVFRSFPEERKQDELNVGLHRLKTFGKALPSGEKEETLQKALSYGGTTAKSVAEAVDMIRYEEARDFVNYYGQFGKFSSNYPEYKKIALEYVNKVQDKSKKDELLTLLNR